jgi:hypothetical protein
MTFEEKSDLIAEVNPDALTADGFEDALIGYVTIFSKSVACYDVDMCLGILMKRDGMTEEEAREFFDFNVTGSYMGEGTPAFLTRFD